MTFGVKSHQDQITDSINQGAKTIGETVGDIKRLVLESMCRSGGISKRVSE
jgi:hypothetical protein